MVYNFDEVIDRNGTNSMKHDFANIYGQPEENLRLWVADMDFRSPKPVIEAVTRVAEHGIYGYSIATDDYFQTLKTWFQKKFNWDVRRDWLIKTPGIVYAISLAIRACTLPGDTVLICEPVYGPFSGMIKQNGRKLAVSRLIEQNGRYAMDLADMEQQIIRDKVKLFLLCSPHNPVGRVWNKEELIALGNLCVKYGVTVLADEIHADIIYPPARHSVFSGLDERFAENTITCTAPSKTFNLPGLQASNIWIPNPELRKAFQKELSANGLGELTPMGIAACKAAYEGGQEWLSQLLDYLQGTIDYVRTFLSQELPQVTLVEPEGTYLLWLDFRNSGIPASELNAFIRDKAGLWLNAGEVFGKAGNGFQRMNIGCPRSIIVQAMTQLKKAFDA